MKTEIAIIIFAHSLSAFAQGTFQDLNFESANIVPIVGSPFYPYAVTVANALPGWTVDYGSVQQTQILYNALSLGRTAATLSADGYPGTPGPILDGNFSLELQGGQVSVSISQTGVIPSGTQSLFFEGAWFPGGPPPDVSIGNDNLTLFQIGGEMFAGNISAWGGQTAQLTVTVPGGYGNYVFDDFSFSTSAVPEPSALALTAIGGLLFALCRRFAPKRQ